MSVILFCGEIFYRVTCGNNNLLFLSDIVSIEIKKIKSLSNIPDHHENCYLKLCIMEYMFCRLQWYICIFMDVNIYSTSCLVMSNANHKKKHYSCLLVGYKYDIDYEIDANRIYNLQWMFSEILFDTLGGTELLAMQR